MLPNQARYQTSPHPDGFFYVVAVVVKHVVNGGFLMGFEKFVMAGNAGVSTVPGGFIFARGGKTYELPKRTCFRAEERQRSCSVLRSEWRGNSSTNCRGKTKTVSIVAQEGGSVKQKIYPAKNRLFTDFCGGTQPIVRFQKAAFDNRGAEGLAARGKPDDS